MPGVGRVLLIVLVILRGASVNAEEKPQGQEEQQSKEEEHRATMIRSEGTITHHPVRMIVGVVRCAL